MRPSDLPPEVLLEKVWPLVIASVGGVAVLNFLAALVIALFGRHLHPAFADSHAWVLFAVAGVAMSVQAVLMSLMYVQLWRRLHPAQALPSGLRGGLRLPVTQALAQPALRRRLRVVRHAARRQRGAGAMLGGVRSVVL